MKNLSSPEKIRETLKKNGFKFSKSLGQNFIADEAVCPQMAENCGADKDTCVIEVGPGMGVLTYELSKIAKKVIAIELDRALIPILNKTLADCDNVEVIHGDIMKMDIKKLIEEKCGGEEVCICANLPYYITSPVVMGLLEGDLPIRTITVMVQKEAAQRICALPGTRECGAVSASVRYHSEPEILFEVGRDSFIPPPNVDSAVIRLNLISEPPVKIDNREVFFKVVKAAFAQRRKTAANSISAVLKIEKAKVESGLENASALKNARAEQLSMEQLAGLANYLDSLLS